MSIFAPDNAIVFRVRNLHNYLNNAEWHGNHVRHVALDRQGGSATADFPFVEQAVLWQFRHDFF